MTPAERYVMNVQLRLSLNLEYLAMDEISLTFQRGMKITISDIANIPDFALFTIHGFLLTYNDWLRWGNEQLH